MKIALAIKNFSRMSGGGERYSVELAFGLAAMGHAVTVFCAGADAELSAVRWLSFVMVPVCGFPSSLRQWSFSRNLEKLLAAYSFDVVYALTECLCADVLRVGGGLARVWLREKAGTRLGYLFERLRLRNILKIGLEDRMFAPGPTRALVFNSRLCLGQTLRTYPFSPLRGRVIHNGVGTDFAVRAVPEKGLAFRKRFGIPAQAPVFLFMSNNYRRKGLGRLLRAFRRVAQSCPGARVLVAGCDNRGMAFYSRFARTLGIGDRVVFAGRVDDAPACFAAADVFALPTMYDPFSNVCVEAMACGLPVITSSMNGASEIIDDGENGFVRDSAEGLAAAMSALLDRGMIKKFSDAARARAARCTLKANIERTEALLCEVARRKNEEAFVRYDDGAFAVSVAGSLAAEPGFEGIGTADGFRRFHEGRVMKSNGKRRVLRAEVGGRVFYIKEQFRVSAREALKMALKFEAPFCQARQELENLLLMRRLGIPSAEPCVCAWEKGLNKSSFLWMRDIGENVRLEDLFARGRGSLAAMRRAALTRVAWIARVLHGNGYVHKDFYLGHLFVLESELKAGVADPTVFLLDVQRVKRVGRWNRRWMLKDLSALYFSALATEFTRREMLRFFVLYLGRGGKAGPKGRALLKDIGAKAARIGLHTEKLLARRRAAAEAGKGNGGAR